MQATIGRGVTFSGIGVHGGQTANATVKPAAAGAGVFFRRTDITDRPNVVPARYDLVADTRLCTMLANESGVTVATVEHLMAALAGLGVTNAEIEIDGPETPIMDGSSEPFVRGLAAAGVVAQAAEQRAIEILKAVRVIDGDKSAALTPCRRFEMRFEIEFEDEAIGRQERAMTLVNGAFIDELCRARTFGRLCEVEMLRKAGLGRGGSLDNAIVVDGARVLNRGGLRYEDEFVRHKMLDAIGDLSLAGAPIIGRYEGVRAGHEITNQLLRALFADKSAWRWIAYDRRKPSALGLDAALAAA